MDGRWLAACAVGRTSKRADGRPMGVAQRPMIELSDDFKAPALKATWGAWKEPDMSRYQVGQGALTVRAKGNSYAESSPLTIKARDESYEVQVVAEIENGTRAALALEYYPSRSEEHTSEL